MENSDDNVKFYKSINADSPKVASEQMTPALLDHALARIQDRFAGQLDKIDTKIDKLSDSQAAMNTTLAVLTETVKTHEQRSTNLESIVLPMKQRETEIHGVLRFLQWAGGFVVGMCAVAEVLRWLIK